MKKIIFALVLVCLAVNDGYGRKELPTYDVRPVNQAPTLERPAWPNYDVQNENSFAVFNTILTAPKQDNGKNVFDGGYWTLYRCKEATYVTYDWKIPEYQDWWFFRFTTGTAIIDADTGDQYLLREVEYFPMDQCFWVHGQSGQTIRFVLVFAPLPQTVKRVQIFEASAPTRKWMEGDAERSRVFHISELRPRVKRAEKEGRVIY
ncbi:MAG: hypothetical protein IJ197_03185 [Bacteroidaceae bacterium]|nr:hypothetical protein [Bacteroidaceae bacterium]